MEAANIAYPGIEFLSGCVGNKEMSEDVHKWLEVYDDLGIVWNKHGHPADIIRHLLAEKSEARDWARVAYSRGRKLEAEIDKWKTEANRLYGVGQDIETDRVELEAQVKRLRELLEYAGGILAHGTPGSAWMDWVLRVQGQLGIEFHNARYEDGHKIPFKRLEERVEHMPKVYLRQLRGKSLKEALEGE